MVSKVFSKLVCGIVLTFTVGTQYSFAITEEEVTATTHEISSTFMSPFCPGKLLSDCPSSSASDLKHQIAQRLSAGESRESIEESLYTLYGDQMRAAPLVKGFGSVAWFTPFLFLVAGIGIFSLWLIGRRKENAQVESAKEASSPSPIDPATRQKIESALHSD